jgi:hypothetical protein
MAGVMAGGVNVNGGDGGGRAYAFGVMVGYPLTI